MEGWNFKHFEECVEPVVYTTKVQRKEFLTDGAYPIVSQEDGLVNGFWNNASDLFRLDHPVVVFGDHTRTLKFIDFDFVLGAEGVKVLKPKPFLNPRYFYYQLHTAKLDSLGYARHYRLLKEHLVSYPALSEQRRIVAILDEAFEAIATAKANTEKSLQNARETFENFMQSLIAGPGPGWYERSLEDVCEIASKLVDPRVAEYLDLPHIGAGNIESKSGAVVDVRTAREEQLISGKFLFDESTVLYSKIRPYLMKVVRPSFGGLCSADIYPLVPKLGCIDRDYLYYLLLTPSFTEYAIKGSARAGMPKVNRDHLFAYRSWMPPVDEQARLASKVDSVACETDRLAEICKSKLTAFDELWSSLLHQAFTGQLTAKTTDRQLGAMA